MAFTKKAKYSEVEVVVKVTVSHFLLPSLLSWCAGGLVLSNQVGKRLRCRDLAALKSNAAVGTALYGGRELLRLIFTWRYSSVLTHNGCSESRKYILQGTKDRFSINSIRWTVGPGSKV